MSALESTPSSLASTLDSTIKAFGADPISALKNIPFKTVGLVGAGILLAVLIVDMLGYLFSVYKGTQNNYTPYSRSLAIYAADAWDNRNSNSIGEYYDPYARARSLEPLTGVLDSLASAAREWGAPEDAVDQNMGSRSRQRAGKPFIFSQ